MARTGKDLSLYLIEQTCPQVDDIMYEALSMIDNTDKFDKEQLEVIDKIVKDMVSHIKGNATEPLREQLNYACDEWIRYEDQVNDLENEISNLISEKTSLENENKELYDETVSQSEEIYNLSEEIRSLTS